MDYIEEITKALQDEIDFVKSRLDDNIKSNMPMMLEELPYLTGRIVGLTTALTIVMRYYERSK